MFVTIRKYQVKAGAIQEVAKRVQKGLVPIVSKQPGFLQYYAVDAGNNVALSVSVYESRAAAEAANKTAAGWVQEHLGGLISGAEVTVGEVIASHAQTV